MVLSVLVAGWVWEGWRSCGGRASAGDAGGAAEVLVLGAVELPKGGVLPRRGSVACWLVSSTRRRFWTRGR